MGIKPLDSLHVLILLGLQVYYFQPCSLNWARNLQVNSKFIKHIPSVILENGREIQQVDLPGESKGWK